MPLCNFSLAITFINWKLAFVLSDSTICTPNEMCSSTAKSPKIQSTQRNFKFVWRQICHSFAQQSLYYAYMRKARNQSLFSAQWLWNAGKHRIGHREWMCILPLVWMRFAFNFFWFINQVSHRFHNPLNFVEEVPIKM